jgi:hypothetical protein
MSFSKTIQMFIFDGNPNGRIMCELSNWNGRVYKISRNELPEFSQRDDSENTGVYFLFGKNEENTFRQQNSGDLDMPFSAFLEIYCQEQKPRLKESTWQTKENIIQQKILPYFGNYKINEITTKDVRAWQNEMLAYRNEDNKPYSSSYLKTLHNQLSAIFNYAV